MIAIINKIVVSKSINEKIMNTILVAFMVVATKNRIIAIDKSNFKE